TLARLAEGIGLIDFKDKTNILITDLGKEYYDARSEDVWSISTGQQALLREYILANPSLSETMYAISSLFDLVRAGNEGDELAHRYAEVIGKEDAWQSEVTYEGFTKFGLSYLAELGFIDNKTFKLHKRYSKQRKEREQGYKTFLFAWNPNKWTWEDMPQAVYEANAEGKYLDKWSCSAFKQISPGDRAFLIRLGRNPKGIIGSGIVVSEPFLDTHWDAEKANKGNKVHRVEILFDMLSERPLLNEASLKSGALEKHNWFPQTSGTIIPDDIAKSLEAEWARVTGSEFTPTETVDPSTLRREGTKRSRLVTTYERSPEAREDCLEHHGTDCKACGFSFSRRYGSVGDGFIHVHHVIPVSAIKEEYEIDPIADLMPVCPNCHAMIHKRIPPYTIDELREILRDNGSQR
ncbi:HNH endonuclease, partial [Nitrospirota bacterium]